MPIVDLNALRVTERLPGWHGRVYEVIQGELDRASRHAAEFAAIAKLGADLHKAMPQSP